MRLIRGHPLVQTLLGLRGNPRACVYTEPLWGLSMNLCLPYASVFMLALGLKDVEVGAVASVYMLSQMIFAFLSGAIIDKLGRRKSTLIFDLLAWSLPCVIWAFAVNFQFFIVAALINGSMMVTTNSWDCLMIEDAEKSQITRIYSLVMICGHMSALFAPISSFLVSKLTLIPAIRILYVNALIVMTLKVVILYLCSRETRVGMKRMAETRGVSLRSQLGGYVEVLGIMRRSKGTVFAIIIAALIAIIRMISNTFWQIIVSQKLGVVDSMLPLFAMFRSLISMFFFFTVIAHISQLRLKNPLLIGFGAYFAGQLILISVPAGVPWLYPALFVSLIFEGFGLGMLMMLSESLIAIHADANERARVLAIFQMLGMAISAPFGWIGGRLSDISRNLPFVMNLTIILIGVAATLIYFRAKTQFLDARD